MKCSYCEVTAEFKLPIGGESFIPTCGECIEKAYQELGTECFCGELQHINPLTRWQAAKKAFKLVLNQLT